MLVPRYLYRGDFSPFRDLLAAQPHVERRFEPGGILWRPGEYIERIYYIEQGIAKTSFVNEDGREKIVYFHGACMVFPDCHEARFTIELLLVTSAVTPVTAMEFSHEAFRRLVGQSPALGSAMLENYARYINVLIFETDHQDKNDALVRLCKLLHPLARLLDEGAVASGRGWLEIADERTLLAHCSYEALGA